MIRSYRIWSAVMSGWYFVVVASLLLRPPGDAYRIVVGGRLVWVPEHRTVFQVLGGADLWATVFAALALALLVTAAFKWPLLRFAHIGLLLADYGFGIGYILAALQLRQGWLGGAFALVTAAAHCLIIRVGGALADIGAVVEVR